MRKRNRKRAAPRVVIVGWTAELVDMFSLPCKLGLTPPAKARVVFTASGSTWTAQFTNKHGDPVRAHVRLRHGALPLAKDPTVVSERMDMRFVLGGPLNGRAGEIIAVDEFAAVDDATVATILEASR